MLGLRLLVNDATIAVELHVKFYIKTGIIYLCQIWHNQLPVTWHRQVGYTSPATLATSTTKMYIQESSISVKFDTISCRERGIGRLHISTYPQPHLRLTSNTWAPTKERSAVAKGVSYIERLVFEVENNDEDDASSVDGDVGEDCLDGDVKTTMEQTGMEMPTHHQVKAGICPDFGGYG